MSPRAKRLAKDLLSFIAALDPLAAEDEQTALEGAQLFTQLSPGGARAGPMATVGPGRFLMPGDLEGSPLLTFFPLALDPDSAPPRGSLGAMMARRFDSYVAHVVRPFFRDHFARLDRQIVLVDVLGAFNGGAEAMAETGAWARRGAQGLQARDQQLARQVSADGASTGFSSPRRKPITFTIRATTGSKRSFGC